MEITYKLHASQFQIFNNETRFVILAAGRRFGKTVLAVVKMLTKACETKKALIWYVAPTYKQAKMIAWEMLLEMIPRSIITKKNEVDLEINLINGSTICLKGADNEDSLRGAGLDFVVLDEYALMKPNVWQDIVRPMLTDRQASALFIGTPKGKNHFWELWMKGQRNELNYFSYQMKTSLNPYISRTEIKDAKDQMNDRAFRQEYEASFEDFTGLIWPEFNYKQHVIEPFQIPCDWGLIGAIDPALTGTTAVLIAAIDFDDQIYIIEEYYEQNKRVSEISEAINKKVSRWWIDPASFVRSINREGKLYSLYDEYADNGIRPFKAENDINAGINRVAEYFKKNKLKIFKTCKNLLYELERYHWSENRETSLGILEPRPYKALDHACDALRYLIMSRSKTFKVQTIIEQGTEADYEKQQEKQESFRQQMEEIYNS